MNDLPRIGLGIDVHRLEPGRPCMLGGVHFDAKVGPVGHSDGDALLHAACDAVLGAAGLDDLGSLFSDRDPANLGRASAEFCIATMARVRAKSLRVLSLDAVVETEAPKLAPHRQAIREKLAHLFELPADRVNVKGKTGEKVDAIGRGEAMRATVVALLGPAIE
ncbi:MAG: 2-C-methyl-D-erythritol 2,4-cyclodiphosphate synthase [Planctomycetes bacterium]|nr:2-C-methyl-D-erythritol 2,4-cyclodiphosphate synthase [Planctomycetota bacterium]MCC7061685.1 2-C-methyl-D-erythritol 2,4-cyclodiphosphate synthase [Planctomycetota bacterium]